MLRPARLLPLVLSAGCFATGEPEPCVLEASGRALTELRAEAVDLLFVIDNSRSMDPYQQALRRELPRLVEGLVTGDHDGDPATPPYPRVSSLRIGFVTTDLGQAGLGEYPEDLVENVCGTGRDPIYGDDARLVDFAIGQDSMANPTGLQCDFDGDGLPDVLSPTELPSFLTFASAATDPPAAEVDAFVRRASCFGIAGIGGCGTEMPLEAALKALTPSTSPIRFHSLPGEGRELGRGDDPASNGSWLRPDSVLAVLLLTDEDDCSTHDRRVLDWGQGPPFADLANPAPGDPGSPYAQRYQRPAGTRCVRFEQNLLEVERFVDGLVALRSDPQRVVFTAITGVPVDLVDEGEEGEGADNLEAILDDPRMAYVVEPDEMGIPESHVHTACIPCPDCEPTEVEAVPARRIVRTALGLRARGANVQVQSLCEDDFADAVENILSKLGVALAPTCVALPLERGEDGLVACHASTTMPPGDPCAAHVAEGYDPVPVRVTDDGRAVCRLRQLSVSRADGTPVVEEGAGFFLDDWSEAARTCGVGARLVSFQGGAGLREDAPTVLDCIVEGAADDGEVDVGSLCDVDDLDACTTDAETEAELVTRYGVERRDPRRNPALLRCERRTETCQLTCSTDTDCPTGTVCADGDDLGDPEFFPRCVLGACC